MSRSVAVQIPSYSNQCVCEWVNASPLKSTYGIETVREKRFKSTGNLPYTKVLEIPQL